MADGHARDVGLGSDDIVPGGDVFGAFAVLQRPGVLGALKLLEVGIAATDRSRGSGSDVPSCAGDGEDDHNRHQHTEEEFARAEDRLRLFDVHIIDSRQNAG
jgi:hypothetical protein